MRRRIKITTLAVSVIILLLLVAATIVERYKGSDFVHTVIYGSWYFIALWIILILLSFIRLFQRNLHKQIIPFLLHISFVIILTGGLLTHYTSEKGSLHLRQNTICNSFSDENGHNYQLPFAVTLNRFDVENHIGTQSPSDYVSTITLTNLDNTLIKSTIISMNNILTYKNYRFYQYEFDEDRQGSTLLVVHDPWGIAVTYSGCILLLLSMVFFMIFDKRFRTMFRKVALPKTAIIGALFLFCSFPTFAKDSPTVLPQEIAAEFGDLHVYHNGRICPLQTLAKDFAIKLYGKSNYKGFTAEQVFTGWMFFYSDWQDEPMLKIEIDANNKKYQLITSLYSEKLLKIFPSKAANDSTDIKWYSQNDDLPKTIADDERLFIQKSLDYASELVITKDYAELSTLLSQIKKYQTKNAGRYLPSTNQFNAEKIYNEFPSLTLLALIALIAGILYLAYYCLQIARKHNFGRYITLSFNVIAGILFVGLNGILCLRWIIGEHIPLVGSDAMIFTGCSALFISFITSKRYKIGLPLALIICGLALYAATTKNPNPQITLLMPVLDSPLMSIHIILIMLSYALFAFMMLNGLTSILLSFIRKDSKQQIEHLYTISRIMLYPAIFCIAAGCFTGAVWANVSWGTYWSWDPKETWTLITFLVYACGAHSESFENIQQPMKFHIFCVIAFLSVLITYFGVNFFIGGIHSFA